MSADRLTQEEMERVWNKAQEISKNIECDNQGMKVISRDQYLKLLIDRERLNETLDKLENYRKEYLNIRDALGKARRINMDLEKELEMAKHCWRECAKGREMLYREMKAKGDSDEL